MITQARLKELFSYDPSTGLFLILHNSGKRRAGRISACKHNEGYIRIYVDGQTYLAHRLAYLYMVGEFPALHMDHINHVRTDNRWENLRMVGIVDNNRNKRATGRSSSGIPGVAWRDKRWYAHISNGKPVYLGAFDDLFSAACSRKSAEIQYGYHENCGRA